MSSGSKKKGIYFGWWIVATCFLLMMTVYSRRVQPGGAFCALHRRGSGGVHHRRHHLHHHPVFRRDGGQRPPATLLEKFDMRKITSILLAVAALSFFGAARSSTLAAQYVWVVVRGLSLAGVLTIPISILYKLVRPSGWKGKAMSMAHDRQRHRHHGPQPHHGLHRGRLRLAPGL